jgi:Zn-dependent metalloprotease
MKLPSALITLVIGLHLSLLPTRAQEKKGSLDRTPFAKAAITWNPDTRMPSDIRLEKSSSLSQEEFFSNLRTTFELPDDLRFVPEKESTGPRGDCHVRYTQTYKGLELARTGFIVHMEEGRVIHANGHLVGEPSVNLVPSLDNQEAFGYACSHLGLNANEARQNNVLMSRLEASPDAATENGKLLLSSGFKEKKAENYQLVYCFDITTLDPLRRYDVEVDAHSGELVGKHPTLYPENIPTTGNSIYNNTVEIVISDTIFKSEWPDNDAYFHPDEWNAYQGTGTSWWMADTADFDPGGYMDNLHVVLETDPILLSGSQPRLIFLHRYAMEEPEGAAYYNRSYDGWDGINVRISTDGGGSWVVLTEPQPAYTCTSLWSFGGIHKEGPGIPGWAGREDTWTRVNFDLSAYLNKTVNIRFEFASDGAFSSVDDSTLFGWQIDDIEVLNSIQTLYSNSGTSTNIRTYSITNWVGSIEGKYRLRETTRGQGIATINAENGLGFTNYVDFVQDTFPMVAEINRVGVGIHWASEETYDYYQETYGRNSYDDHGGTILSYANWKENGERNNAFWTSAFAAYGAGDGENYGSFGTIDIVGHEITHGVTAHSAKLVYQGEPGALNESFSDIFGTAVEFYAVGSEKGDWLNGEDVFKGLGAIRSLKDPKIFSCPDTYLGEYWYNTVNSNDYGGVHTNSGVQNHWFYLLSEGGSGENDDGVLFHVTGIGLEDAAAVAYRNLTNYLLPDSRYTDAATYSIQAAGNLFGEESQQVESTRSAWEAVGIYSGSRLFPSDTLLHFESAIHDSDSVPLKLRNKGIETLHIGEFLFSDPDHFTIGPPLVPPLQMEAGGALELNIVFSPGFEGAYNETLTIESSDPEHPVQTIRLSGVGTADETGLPENYQDNPGIELSVTPNPFSERLLISYALPQPDHITIEIRDITGKLIYHSTRYAADKETVEILWGSIPDNPRASSGGIYLLSLRTGNQVLVKKMVKR